MPKACRWTTLKKVEGQFTEAQLDALAELVAMGLHTVDAWRVKEFAPLGAQGHFHKSGAMTVDLVSSCGPIAGCPYRSTQAGSQGIVYMLISNSDAILARWQSGHSNARIEALNGIFQAAKRWARGYRNDEIFISSIIYLLAAPIQKWLKST